MKIAENREGRSLNFSKSRYVNATKCPKMLWLEVNKPELCETSADAQEKMDVGHAVGELAQKRFDGCAVRAVQS